MLSQKKNEGLNVKIQSCAGGASGCAAWYNRVTAPPITSKATIPVTISET